LPASAIGGLLEEEVASRGHAPGEHTSGHIGFATREDVLEVGGRCRPEVQENDGQSGDPQDGGDPAARPPGEAIPEGGSGAGSIKIGKNP
jgi:hypothetical protein